MIRLDPIVNAVQATIDKRSGCGCCVGRRRLGSAFLLILRAAVLSAGLGSLSTLRAAQPARAVSHTTVISRRDPAVEITLPGSARYVGSDRFVLTDRNLGKFDECELYTFVRADASRRVRELYWVQFEAYLPSHPQLHHAYDSPRHASIGGLDFYVDMWVAASTRPTEPGSDEAHLHALLAAHGYRRGDFMYVRLVHLTDATRRKELMIIYAQTLAPTGYTAAQLAPGGSEHRRWASIASGLLRRAEHGITVRTFEDLGRQHHPPPTVHQGRAGSKSSTRFSEGSSTRT